MKAILLFLLPFLLMVQLANGNVIVNNTSDSKVSVYDVNTTIVTDPLGKDQWTSFVLGSAGPDLFNISKYGQGGTVLACRWLLNDGTTLLLYTDKKKRFRCKLVESSSPAGAAAGPTSNSQELGSAG